MGGLVVPSAGWLANVLIGRFSSGSLLAPLVFRVPASKASPRYPCQVPRYQPIGGARFSFSSSCLLYFGRCSLLPQPPRAEVARLKSPNFRSRPVNSGTRACGFLPRQLVLVAVSLLPLYLRCWRSFGAVLAYCHLFFKSSPRQRELWHFLGSDARFVETCNNVIFVEAGGQRRSGKERTSRTTGYPSIFDETGPARRPFGAIRPPSFLSIPLLPITLYSPRRSVSRTYLPFPSLPLPSLTLSFTLPLPYLTLHVLAPPHFNVPFLSFPFFTRPCPTLPHPCIPLHYTTLHYLNLTSPSLPDPTVRLQAIARQEKLFEKRKWRLIGDNVFVGLLGTSGAWCLSFKAACSFGLGVTLGTAYLVLLSRFVENLGKEGSEGGGRGGGGGGPARLALAGLLVLLVSKNKETLEFIPALTGFLAYQVGGFFVEGGVRGLV